MQADGAAEAPATPAAADPDFYRATPYDLEPLTLSAAPLLDGYVDDWPHDAAAWSHFDKDARHRFAILTGVHERMLYLLLEVHDEHPLFDAPGNNPLEPSTFGDRVWLGFEDPQGEQQQVFIAATAPGAVIARRIESGEYGRQSARLEPRIRGAWMPTPDGYRLELRVPLSLIGKGFGVLIDDRDTRGALPVSYGTLRPDDLHTIGHLILAAPQLNTYLGQFLQPGLRLAVTTPAGRVLARADALAQPTGLGTDTPMLERLYRRFIDRPGERQPLIARSPIYDRDHAVEIGQLEVTRSPDRWIRLRDRALTHMLNFTLATSAIVVTRDPGVRRVAGAAARAAAPRERVRPDRHAGSSPHSRRPPPGTSSATSPAASRRCSRACTSTRATCARSRASSPTRSARRSPSCAPRSITWTPRRCRRRHAPTSSARVRGPSA